MVALHEALGQRIEEHSKSKCYAGEHMDKL